MPAITEMLAAARAEFARWRHDDPLGRLRVWTTPFTEDP